MRPRVILMEFRDSTFEESLLRLETREMQTHEIRESIRRRNRINLMKCYTSYFARVKSLPSNIVPIAICGKSPEGWTGLEYKALAPKWWFFKEWKENHDNDFYIKYFNAEVLDKLNPEKVWDRLIELSEGRPFALICYETPSDFCHRHLVSEWLRSHGYDIEEYVKDNE